MPPLKPMSNDYLFRELHPLVFLGTASDRYAGWIGQVYPETYQARITRRTKRVGGGTFLEEVLPVDSVRHYFQHFRILELDFTFYGPLLDDLETPTRTYRTLERYTRYLGPEDRLVVKVPQAVFARKLRKAGGFVENPAYLDADFFRRRFYEPALELAGLWLSGFVFEQEYQRKQACPDPAVHAAELEAFFASVPEDSRYHVELRTPSLWTASVISVLESHGVGQVLSHWTWLPPLERQFSLSGGRCLNGGNTQLIRLMTPRGVRYEDAYARAFPFNAMVEGMLDPGMIDEAVRIMWSTVAKEAQVCVIVNNRAGGNAPLIARQLAETFVRADPEQRADRL